MQERKLAVVKYGSETVTNHSGVDKGAIYSHANKIANLGMGVIVVTSGAVKTGEAYFNQYRNKGQQLNNESYATIGNIPLMSAWQDAFKAHGKMAGEMFITHREIKDRVEGPKFITTLYQNLINGIITVINENDAVNNEELVKYLSGADNDELAYEVAVNMEADYLLYMTTVPGLLDSNGQVISKIACDPLSYIGAAYYAGEKNDKGQGMPTKSYSAGLAAISGIETFIASSNANLNEVMAGQAGTHYFAAAA